MTFEKSEEVEKAVEKLMAAVADMDRGDVIKWRTIEKITGASKGVGIWQSIKRHLQRRLLKERGIAVWCLKTGGWKLLDKSEQIIIPGEKRRKRAFRQTSKAVKEIGAVAVSKLSVNESKLRALHLSRFKEDRRSLRVSMKQAKLAVLLTEPRHRRNDIVKRADAMAEVGA